MQGGSTTTMWSLMALEFWLGDISARSHTRSLASLEGSSVKVCFRRFTQALPSADRISITALKFFMVLQWSAVRIQCRRVWARSLASADCRIVVHTRAPAWLDQLISAMMLGALSLFLDHARPKNSHGLIAWYSAYSISVSWRASSSGSTMVSVMEEMEGGMMEGGMDTPNDASDSLLPVCAAPLASSISRISWLANGSIPDVVSVVCANWIVFSTTSGSSRKSI